jgi:putative FmdB family regulatory protein
MPIYEYRCRKCRRRFSVLTLRVGEKAVPVCDRCGSKSADRLLSRFAMPKSEEARLDSLGDPSSLGGVDESDPRSVARWMRKVGREMGEDVAGEDFDEMMDQLEAGEDGDEGEGMAGTDGGDDE